MQHEEQQQQQQQQQQQLLQLQIIVIIKLCHIGDDKPSTRHFPLLCHGPP